jgi:hypothetical protein
MQRIKDVVARRIAFAVLGLASIGISGCSETPEPRLPPPGMGEVGAALAVPPELQAEVPSVRFEVEGEDGAIQVAVVPVEPDLPGFAGAGLAGQSSASWYVTVNPGRYLVRAIPLDPSSRPSTSCGMATGFATVSSGKTTELMLVSNCTLPGSGGLDISLRVNQGPFITDLTFLNGTRICASEAAELDLAAVDRDADQLETMWRVIEFPTGAGEADICLAGSSTEAVFSAVVPGEYGFEVQVSDGADSASLEFSIEVVDCGEIPACPGSVFEFPAAEVSVGRCDCEAAFCGNGVIEAGESCETPGSGSCNTDCTLVGEVREAFALSPPKIESAVIKAADPVFDGKTTHMTVTVAKEDVARVGTALSFLGEGGKVFTLFDVEEGVSNKPDDGVYTGKVLVSAASLDKAASSREAAATRRSTEQVFSGREAAFASVSSELPTSEDLDSGASFEVHAKGFALTNPERTLMVTDLSVVEDPTRTFDPCTGAGNPDGAWTFKTLMTAMANTPVTGIAPEDFVRQWLESFAAQNVIANGESTEARNQMMNIIADWEQVSGVGPGGPLDLDQAPFRLNAIVNRLDLGGNLGYKSTAGEGRFVFSVFSPLSPCGTFRFTVILEYGIPLRGCDDIQAYACQWQALDTLPFPSNDYNDALQALTDVFALAGANPNQIPNQSAINQVRTNDQALGQSGWEFREFKPDEASGHLVHVGLALQPRHETPEHVAHVDTENMSLDLSSFIMNNLSEVLSETHTVPEFWPGNDTFQAATVTYDSSNFFEGPAPAAQTLPDNEARHKFSLNTCSGCHGGETTTSFVHVSQRPNGVPSSLSGFLTGITVTDPFDQVTQRNFEDLTRRNQHLDSLCNQSCSLRFLSDAVVKVH